MTRRVVVQFSRFLVVGVLNTAVDLAVLNLETVLSDVKDGVGYAVQKGVSFSVAVVFSYFLNKRWTFEDASRTGRKKKFSRFAVVSILGALIHVFSATFVVTYVKPIINPALDLAILTDQLWVNIGALCGTAAGFLWNFLGYKFLVFRPAGAPKPKGRPDRPQGSAG
jgi:putative flippase GtrA